MTAVLEKPRPRKADDAPEKDNHSDIPSTDATTRPPAESIFLPGTLLYDWWLELLRKGTISYEEFIDWTTPGDPRSAGKRAHHTLRLLLSGLMGTASGRRP
jgi:hypothetical protein